jgi:hypothetical protein
MLMADKVNTKAAASKAVCIAVIYPMVPSV